MGYVNDQKMEEIRMELPEMGNDPIYQTLISTVEKLKEQCPEGLEGVILLVDSIKGVKGKSADGERNVRALIACEQDTITNTITNLFGELAPMNRIMVVMEMVRILKIQDAEAEIGGATVH